jgi:hypothetical protein
MVAYVYEGGAFPLTDLVTTNVTNIARASINSAATLDNFANCINVTLTQSSRDFLNGTNGVWGGWRWWWREGWEVVGGL